MYYYEVAPADRSYKNNRLLTYSHATKLLPGQVVVVNLRSKKINGFIVKQVNKPAFPTKEIFSAFTDYLIPKSHVNFFENFNKYYPGTIGATSSLFIPSSFKVSNDQKTTYNNVIKKTTKVTLSKDQDSTIKTILKSDQPIHIVHGDTGTGKTLIYLELTKKIISTKKSVIVLTPEISLTPQLFEQFFSIFSNVYLIHSKMTNLERRKIWFSINQSAEPVIIIGPRSALFMPVKDIGLIVVDEFHDSAYKQDQAPKFQTIRVAAILRKITRSKLILGSATPPIEDYFYAIKKGAEVHRLINLPNNKIVERNIKIINIGDKNESTGHSLISKSLLEAIQQQLDQNQQSMIFLNKRGSSRTIVCKNCGWIAKCSRCDIPYVYHNDKHKLICHICNLHQPAPSSCQDCNHTDLQFKNPGTKQIEASLKIFFPKAKIGRYDKDNIKSETFYVNQPDILSGKVDILIGTQLLTKGHDLPNLGLVAVLSADSGLQFPDYSSSEKNFQTIHQIIGRVGRGHRKGVVILQTFGSTNHLHQFTEQKNDTWLNFYKLELAQRQKYHYPPFSFLLKIEVSRSSEENLIKNIEKIAQEISIKHPEVQVIGPAPSLINKRNNKYFWQIIVKSKNRLDLLNIINGLPKNCSFDLDPINLL